MGVYCNNSGSQINNARNVEKKDVGKTKDGATIYEVTYSNSAGETEGYVSIQTSSGEKLLRWSGYKVIRGSEVPWEMSRAYGSDHARSRTVSQLELR